MPDAAVPVATKLCKGCGHILDVACFGLKYPERGTRQHLCRVCSRAASRMYCGIRDLAVLEFDHRDPRQKEVEIAELTRHAWSWARILTEIAKCAVVCANCHRRRTARYFGWRRLLGLEELVLPALPKRGAPDYERIKSTRSRLARRHRNRMYLYTYLREHPCVLCGEADPVMLEFDHLRDKRREVTILAILSGRANLVAEIAKCRVLCANCHRRHTAERAGRRR